MILCTYRALSAVNLLKISNRFLFAINTSFVLQVLLVETCQHCESSIIVVALELSARIQ